MANENREGRRQENPGPGSRIACCGDGGEAHQDDDSHADLHKSFLSVSRAARCVRAAYSPALAFGSRTPRPVLRSVLAKRLEELAEQIPLLAVEPGQLLLLDRRVVGRARVDLHSR
jgi:hypothetical protein